MNTWPGDPFIQMAVWIRSGLLEMYDARLRLRTVVDLKQPDRDWQIEPTWPARSGIKIEHTLITSDPGLMRVSEQNSRKLCHGRVQVQRMQVVEHVDILALEQHDFCFRQLAARAAPIHIATDRRNGGDFLQGFDN